VPVFDTRGDLQDFFTFKDFGLVYGIGFHFNVKYAANKKASIFPYLSFGFCQLQNDDNENAYIDSNIIRGYPLPGNQTYGNKVNGNSILALRIIHLGLGAQYYFSSKHQLLPFIGAEIDYNSIWGFYEQTPTVVTGNAPAGKTYFTINNTTRIGVGIDAGLDYRITKNLGFVFGTKFKIANLFGKNSESSNDINKMNLLDKAATNLNSNLSTSRNINYFEFYIGFSVFAGSR
jgi:outer membrane protein W